MANGGLPKRFLGPPLDTKEKCYRRCWDLNPDALERDGMMATDGSCQCFKQAHGSWETGGLG